MIGTHTISSLYRGKDIRILFIRKIRRSPVLPVLYLKQKMTRCSPSSPSSTTVDPSLVSPIPPCRPYALVGPSLLLSLLLLRTLHWAAALYTRTNVTGPRVPSNFQLYVGRGSPSLLFRSPRSFAP